MDFQMISPGINNGIIDLKYGSFSGDQIQGIPQLSLPLQWEHAPQGTKYFAVTMIDYTNCELDGVPWIHWSVANIPGDVLFLPEDAGRNMAAVSPEIVQGKNSWMTMYPKEREECNGYGGPAPLAPSEYEFRVYALKSPLALKEGFFFNYFMKELQGKILGEAILYGTYEYVEPS